MTLAGIELRYLVNEIIKKIDGYYVSNIYGISRDSLLFKLHHPEKPDILLMFSTLGLWITTIKIEQIEENRLVKRLRNDLLRSKISSIKQIGAERIAYVTFNTSEQEFVLIGEFFGDGNIILCDKNMKILALLHSIDVRHRKLNVGFNYEPPPQSGLDIFNITPKDLIGILSVSTPAVRWIGRTLGIPAKYAEEIVGLAEIDPLKPGNSLSEKDVEKIFVVTKNLVEKIVNGIHDPVLVKTESGADVFPVKLGHIENTNYTKITSFMEGLDSLFTPNLLEHGKSSQANTVTQKIEEFEHKLEDQIKAISVVKEKAGAISKVAKSLLDLVSKGVTSLESSAVIDVLRKQNANLVKERGILFIDVNGEKIKINPDSSLQAVASVLFNESKRQINAIEFIESAKKKTAKSLESFRKQEDIARDSVGLP